MNVVERYLEQHRERLGLAALGVPPRPACLLLTPRLPLSRHVVALVLDGRRPVLVAKLPRRAGDGEALAREAANLRAAYAAVAGTRAAAPRLVAFDERPVHPVLLETALDGRPLGPRAMRRDNAGIVAAVADALAELVARTARPAPHDWYEELLREPLERLAAWAGAGSEVAALAARTLAATSELAAAQLPSVLEHGDLAHPNLLALAGGRIGILDWEAGTPRGLPAADLVFFLGYAAGGAPPAAFAARYGWAWHVLARYARCAGIDPGLVAPLALACAARAVAALPARAGGRGADGALGAWLPRSRQAAVWRALLSEAGRAAAATARNGVIA